MSLGIVLLLFSISCHASDLTKPRYSVCKLVHPVRISHIRELAPYIENGPTVSPNISLASLISTVIDIKHFSLQDEGLVAVQWHPDFRVFSIRSYIRDEIILIQPQDRLSPVLQWKAKKVAGLSILDILKAFDGR